MQTVHQFVQNCSRCIENYWFKCTNLVGCRGLRPLDPPPGALLPRPALGALPPDPHYRLFWVISLATLSCLKTSSAFLSLFMFSMISFFIALLLNSTNRGRQTLASSLLFPNLSVLLIFNCFTAHFKTISKLSRLRQNVLSSFCLSSNQNKTAVDTASAC